jgi:hypothetical protein
VRRISALALIVSVGTLAAVSVVPSLTIADSTGVPFLAGSWHGELKSVYWDQSVVGSLKPKKKFKTKVTVNVAQGMEDDQLAVTFTYDDPLPTSASTADPVDALSGFVGNGHLNLSNNAPAFALSGEVNGKGSQIKLTGVMGTDSLTHELTIKLKKDKN